MSLAEVARAVGGELTGPDATVTAGVEVDSRQVVAGGLFVALPGERTDGHDHVAAAHAAGAVGALVERAVTGVPCVVVPDALVALQALARQVLARDQPLTYGVTGSSGKTSTKDLLAHLLGGSDMVAPVGSFNNEVGLPLTCLRRTAGTRAVVLEYSARGVGHIAFLCSIARPHVAIVLNVGSAHLSEFGSVAAIAQAKGELVEAVLPFGDAPGRVVLNGDDPRVAAMADRAPAGSRVLVFGAGGDVAATDVVLDAGGRAAFTLVTGGERERVQLDLVGAHQVGNALAALLAASDRYAGPVPHATAVARLQTATAASRWRMEVTERPDGVTVVNDAYNANPESVRSALGTLATMGGPAPVRRWAVLGPLAELGEHTDPAQHELGRLAAELGVDRVVTVGPGADAYADGFEAARPVGAQPALRATDVRAAVTALRAELRPGDVVLVKASRSAGLEELAGALLDPPAPGPAARPGGGP